MESLATHLIARIGDGEVDPARLAAAGIADPADALRAFGEAARDPDLARALEHWVAPLLVSAQPAAGARSLLRLAAARRDAGTPLELREVPALPALLGASGFLSRRLLAHPDWIDELAGATPAAPGGDPIAADWRAIRLEKYRGLLRIAARDLVGRPFADSLGELSQLAERCLEAGVRCARDELGGTSPAVLALGKLGGRELNFSSDVDLLVVYPLTRGVEPGELAERHTRLVQRLKSRLEQPSEEGFGYRVDLDLRPEGAAGVLVNPFEAALTYYESFGAEWERQALIRLRPVAGDLELGDALLEELRPFVYRKLIGPDVLHAVRDMKHRIERERREAGRDLDACLKEGPGGIRDVEFLVQAFQLLHGGREPSLRTGNVLAALDALARLDLLAEETAQALSAAYLWLRRAEHALQLAEEQQTSRVPRDPASQLRLARRMGYATEDARAARDSFQDDWTTVRGEVRAHFEALVLGETR